MVIIITIDFPLDKDSPHSKIFHLERQLYEELFSSFDLRGSGQSDF